MSPLLAQEIPEGLNVRRAAKLTAWLGIAYSLLVLGSYYMLSLAPRPSSSDEEYLAFYDSDETRVILIAGLYLMPFAGIAFMWFIVMLRAWIRRTASRVDDLFSSVQLVSGILYLALFLTAAAAISVLSAGGGSPEAAIDPSTKRQFTQMGWGLVVVFAMRMAAIFVITTTTLGRRHRFLPQWFVILGYLVGAFLLLSANTAPFLILVLPGWTLLLGLLLLARARSLPTTVGPTPSSPSEDGA
ncbi:MAG TPA: hypothetical protein VFZ80_03610 [Acidimicrobiia bacterium]